ncbi:transcriptional regulator [Pseudoxanthomonas kalamensis DSM 18571]|uniref:ATP-binding protein n=1 Tax=Pseudoxanthomonas kalamensis TaxID=289483 RepID=UPI0013913F52|nr:ATP-binding protein [Pseudoxanthomonas kalamensis]KAF1712188.1 transcriptional regulator [Pseudoxanthomonas kalamensis DSM 18571]
MTSAHELLQSLNLLDEHERIEAKRSDEVGKSLLETICALANEPGLDGGWILLGVIREELALFPSYEVEGLDQPDKISADLASQCATTFNQPVRIQIATEQLDGKTVIVVSVPEAAAQDKPIYFKAQGLPRGAFRRIGSTDQRCTEDDLLLLYQGRQVESFDAGLVPDAAMDDFSPDAIAEYRAALAETYPDAEALRWSDEDLLQALGCTRRDPQGEWQSTVAGLLLFGKSTALRRCFPMTRVDYIRVPGRDWVPDPERRFDTLEMRDPLFRLVRRAQAAVLDDLPKAFGLQEGELQRQDRPLIPQVVIREALVNAVMHRNYRNHAPIQIIRYANRLEIRNPGFSLKSPEHLGEPGSAPRNPKIAAVLHETRFAETKGSGIRVMRDKAAEAGLTPPLFESDRGRDQFVARFFFHHFLGEDDLRWLARFRDLHLNDAEARALVVAREAGAMDNATYRDLNKVDTLAASAALRRLRDAGLFEQQGRGSATWYRPTDALLGEGTAEREALSAKPKGLSSNPGDVSSNLPALSSNPAVQHPEETVDARARLLDELPGALAAQVGGLGKRNVPEAVSGLVVDLCGLRAWSADELALLMGRNAEYVRQNYLRPLMRAGRITMTRPEVPNDPEQAYQAIDGTGNGQQ